MQTSKSTLQPAKKPTHHFHFLFTTCITRPPPRSQANWWKVLNLCTWGIPSSFLARITCWWQLSRGIEFAQLILNSIWYSSVNFDPGMRKVCWMFLNPLARWRYRHIPGEKISWTWILWRQNLAWWYDCINQKTTTCILIHWFNIFVNHTHHVGCMGFVLHMSLCTHQSHDF